MSLNKTELEVWKNALKGIVTASKLAIEFDSVFKKYMKTQKGKELRLNVQIADLEKRIKALEKVMVKNAPK